MRQQSSSIHIAGSEALLNYFFRYFKMSTSKYLDTRNVQYHTRFFFLFFGGAFKVHCRTYPSHQLPMNQINEKFNSRNRFTSIRQQQGLSFWFVRAIWSETHFDDVNIIECDAKKKLKSIALQVCVLSQTSILRATHSNISWLTHFHKHLTQSGAFRQTAKINCEWMEKTHFRQPKKKTYSFVK